MSLVVAAQYLAQGEWEKAHSIAQADDSALGAWAHGIVHLEEGDLDNARYWFGRARRPFPSTVDIPGEVAALAAALQTAGK
jgi:hypothetical protein